MASCLHLITLLSVAVLASADVSWCPCGWSQFGNRCFIVHNNPLIMADAEAECMKGGGHLASYLNRGEVNFVKGLLKHGNLRTWTGLNDAVKEGLWWYTDGSHFNYKPWAKGEPNNNGSGEDCVEMYPSGLFNDLSCTAKRAFVCSKHA